MKINLGDSRNPSLALPAIRVADVRFGILPTQSRLRGDDEGFEWLQSPNDSRHLRDLIDTTGGIPAISGVYATLVN